MSEAADRERWEAIEKVLDGALDLPPERRTEFLAEACAGDEALRAEVESLLEAHEAAGTVRGEFVLQVKGTVVRSRSIETGKYGIAAEFSRMDDEEREMIRRFIFQKGRDQHLKTT